MPILPGLKDRFPEPVVDAGADPYVVMHDDHFYYCHVIKDEAIYIRKAATLDALGTAEAVKIWDHPSEGPEEIQLWAPELHQLDGKWYVYYAAGPKVPDAQYQRMYVAEGIGDDPQTAQYELRGKIADPADEYAIDGTVLTMPDSTRYFVWSGWESEDDRAQNLYIAEMATPWILKGERVRIASPVYPWEQIGPHAVNEGPQILPHGDKRHIIYSASHSLTDYYCLGQLSLAGDNPLEPTHWVKHPKPVFESHAGLIAPGHASFLLTPDEKYGWMIFHAARHAGAGWDRQVRLRAFEMTADDTPNFLPATSLRHQFTRKLPLLRLLEKLQQRAPGE